MLWKCCEMCVTVLQSSVQCEDGVSREVIMGSHLRVTQHRYSLRCLSTFRQKLFMVCLELVVVSVRRLCFQSITAKQHSAQRTADADGNNLMGVFANPTV